MSRWAALVLGPAGSVALPSALGYHPERPCDSPSSPLLLLAGCASGPHYWTKPGADPVARETA